MQAEGQVGPQVLSDGAQQAIRIGKSGEVSIAEAHGRYYEATYRKQLFTAYAGGVVVTLANTTATGLILLNPLGNNKNCVLQKTGGFIAVTSASTTGIVLGTFQQNALPTGLTAITIQSNFIATTPGATAAAYSAATIANAQTPLKTLLHNTAAIGTTGEDQGWELDFEGSVIVPPGFGVSLVALGAATAASSVFADLSWEEVAI